MVNCPRCRTNNAVKAGLTQAKRQRYLCNNCRYYFQTTTKATQYACTYIREETQSTFTQTTQYLKPSHKQQPNIQYHRSKSWVEMQKMRLWVHSQSWFNSRQTTLPMQRLQMPLPTPTTKNTAKQRTK